MASGSKNWCKLCRSSFSDGLMAVELDEDRSSSSLSSFDGKDDQESRCSAPPSVSSLRDCLRMCFVIPDSENVRFEGLWRL